MIEIGKKYGFVNTRTKDITLYEVTQITIGNPTEYTFKKNKIHESVFQLGSDMYNHSFEVDSDTTPVNVKDKYPEYFL